MSILKLPVRFVGPGGNEKYLYSLFDSGADFSCISQETVESMQLSPEKLGVPMRLITASEGHWMEVDHATRIQFYIGDVLLSDEFLAVPDISEEVIIGVTTMQKWRMKLNFARDQVEVDPNAGRGRIGVLKLA